MNFGEYSGGTGLRPEPSGGSHPTEAVRRQTPTLARRRTIQLASHAAARIMRGAIFVSNYKLLCITGLTPAAGVQDGRSRVPGLGGSARGYPGMVIAPHRQLHRRSLIDRAAAFRSRGREHARLDVDLVPDLVVSHVLDEPAPGRPQTPKLSSLSALRGARERARADVRLLPTSSTRSSRSCVPRPSRDVHAQTNVLAQVALGKRQGERAIVSAHGLAGAHRRDRHARDRRAMLAVEQHHAGQRPPAGACNGATSARISSPAAEPWRTWSRG